MVTDTKPKDKTMTIPEVADPPAIEPESWKHRAIWVIDQLLGFTGYIDADVWAATVALLEDAGCTCSFTEQRRRCFACLKAERIERGAA